MVFPSEWTYYSVAKTNVNNQTLQKPPSAARTGANPAGSTLGLGNLAVLGGFFRWEVGRMPFTVPDIPGSFVDPDTKSVRFRRVNGGEFEWTVKQMGARSARQYVADVRDGYLLALVSQEPHGDVFKWHLSLSHRPIEAHKKPFRLPTWDELKLARYRLVPREVPMASVFPCEGQHYENSNDWVLHLWECPNSWIEE